MSVVRHKKLIKKPPRTVAILEVMWDNRIQTAMASPGYLAMAPRGFCINPNNTSGARLYKLLGHKNLLVTNACPQIVGCASQHGDPDAEWLRESVEQLYPFNLLLVCGNVAQATYDSVRNVPGEYRTIYMPHPAARQWSKAGIAAATRYVREGTTDLHLRFQNGTVRAKALPPF